MEQRGDATIQNSRGQAATEFLMTYGFALLVVLITIAALAFFGVLNPSKLLPSSCTLGPGFSCQDFVVKSDGAGNQYIQMNVQNGMGKDFDFFAVQVQKASDTSPELCGGFWGIVLTQASGTPTCWSGNQCSLIFEDGETKPISHLLPSANAIIEDKITCSNIPFQTITINCCTALSDMLLTSGAFLNPPPAFDDCSDFGLTMCNDPGNVNYIMQPKSRFKEELVIYYKTQGSSLIHRRTGMLSAEIEQA